MQTGAITRGQNVVIVDDLIATGKFIINLWRTSAKSHCTGGSALAAAELVNKSGGNIVEFLFCIEVAFL